MPVIAADRDRLKQLVQALPPTRRLIVVLHCYERLTWAEIGEVLGLPAGRVQAVYESIVKAFKRQLARDLPAAHPRCGGSAGGTGAAAHPVAAGTSDGA